MNEKRVVPAKDERKEVMSEYVKEREGNLENVLERHRSWRNGELKKCEKFRVMINMNR
jgi:hypothetical protein